MKGKTEKQSLNIEIDADASQTKESMLLLSEEIKKFLSGLHYSL